MRDRVLQIGCWGLAGGCGCYAMLTGAELRAQNAFWPKGAWLAIVVILGFAFLIGAIHFGREVADQRAEDARLGKGDHDWE